jgi:hypothetical protein
MSMMAAVDLAITLQLVADGKTDYKDYKRIVGAPVAAAGTAAAIAGHDYNETTVTVFLQMIAMRLNSDKPPLNFDWVSTDAKSCLSANRETLINRIARNTTPIADKANGGK